MDACGVSCRRIVPTYPNGYRFVVMGRLVEKGRVLDYDRTVTDNPTALAPWNINEKEAPAFPVPEGRGLDHFTVSRKRRKAAWPWASRR